MSGALPFGNQLASRGIINHSQCIRCGEQESAIHIFFHCQFAQQVWNLAPFKEQINSLLIQHLPIGVALSKQLTCLPPTGIVNDPLMPWILWLARKKKIFNDRTCTMEETILKAVQDAKEWFAAESLKPKGIKVSNLPKNSLKDFSDAAWISDTEEA